MADKAKTDSKKERTRRTDAERLADLQAQIAKIENKEQVKKAKRTQFLVSSIAILDQRIAKLEARRADLDAELADLATDSAEQLTFDQSNDAESA
jgi:hypothetical protein